MPAGISEDLDHQIRGAVDDLGMVAELRSRIHEAGKLDAPYDAIEVTVAGRFQPCEQV